MLKIKFVFLLAPLLVVGCASIPNPFHSKADMASLPADALKQVALQIETAIQNGEREPQITGDSVVANTEEIKQAIRTRSARSELLNQFLDSGFGVEKANGHLYVVRDKSYKKATTGQDRDRNALLVADEATNRWTLFEGLVKANKWPSGSLSAVQQIFHEARVAVMKNGQKYEDANGVVVVKGS